MRSKLFFAFMAVILLALVSNFIFEHLIIRDFEEYVHGLREDQVFWVLAATEGSHTRRGWDMRSLARTLHWAMMLGFETRVVDAEGRVIMESENVFNYLSPSMRHRMAALSHPMEAAGAYEDYPLFMRGEEIGVLQVRKLSREGFIKEKEKLFKQRGRDFLIISFLIAGGGALFLSLVFSLYFSRPVLRLRRAAAAVAKGDLSTRVRLRSRDELGELAGSFNHMVESLEREESLRRKLISNVAHELRTPLAIMKATLEAVEDGVHENQEQAMASISGELERLIVLVQGIEDITRAEASFLKRTELAPVDVCELLEGLAQSQGPIFSRKGLDLSINAREMPLTVETDAEKLETIVRNLLSNALHHTERGSVKISCGPHPGDRVFIEVSDTGSGITREDLPRIFKRFEKGRDSHGIGVGLSIASELAAVLGGSLEVESSEGLGSSFKLILPKKGGEHSA